MKKKSFFTFQIIKTMVKLVVDGQRNTAANTSLA
jgi:hypothetical protein